MSKLLPMLMVDGALFVAGGYFGYMGRTSLSLSILGVAILLAGCQWLLFDCLRVTSEQVRIERNIKQPHYIQSLLQITLYCYWGLYWDEVKTYAPLIAVQIAFAYGMEMLVSWSRYKVWRAGFGPIPVVLSINLFLWFKEEYFFLQLALIAVAFLGKEFVHWTRDGRSVHIFNPSAFPLAVTSILMLATGSLGLSRGVDIIETFILPPNMFEVIFLLGLVVQYLYATTPVSLGTMLSLYLLFKLALVVVGIPLSPTYVNVSVMLALTLLITDPSTTPRSQTGKFLFGLAYGAGIFFVCIALRMTQQPSFVDKILMVPVVNLLVPAFDRMALVIERWTSWAADAMTAQIKRYAWMVLYTALFLSILPALKTPFPQPKRLPFPRPATGSSPSVTQVLRNREYCRVVYPAPFQPFGFRSEIELNSKIRLLYRNGVEADVAGGESQASEVPMRGGLMSF